MIYYSVPKNISRLCNSKFGHMILPNIQKEISLLSIMPLLNSIVPKIQMQRISTCLNTRVQENALIYNKKWLWKKTGMGVELNTLNFWRQYTLVFARMFWEKPKCWLSYSRAEQHPGSCCRSSELPIQAAPHQQPAKGRASPSPGTAAVPRKGDGDSLEAFLSPQMPKHFHNSLLLKKAVAHRYELLRLRRWCSNNLDRNPSQSHLKFSVKGSPVRHLDIMTTWQLCRTRLTAELHNDKYRDRPTPMPHNPLDTYSHSANTSNQ